MRSTRYKLPDANVITLTQGPRALLRMMLRQTDGASGTFTSAAYGSTPSPQYSKQVQVTIAGEPHDAWLLPTPTEAALVVEINDVLVYISGPANYVDGVLLEQLPALKWEPVVLPQSGSGGAIEVKP